MIADGLRVNKMTKLWFFEILYLKLTALMGRVGLILYLGGGGDAPDPDPQIGAAALKNAELGKDAFDWYKQKYEDSLPQQNQLSDLAVQVQQQLVESGDLNNAYAKDYHDYMTDTFRPLEKSIVDNANNYDTVGRREAEASKGLSDVRQSFDTQRQMTQRNNERMGINPNSGNALALNKQNDVAEAVAGANATNAGRKQAEQMGTALQMDAASLGRNLPSNQATSQQIANSSATSAVNVGLSDANNVRANTSTMQNGFSTAMQGYTNQANILNNQYQNQLSAYNTQQQGASSSTAAIGTIAGAAMMMMSDENVKTDIKDYDENAALSGLKKVNVKEWKYDKNKVKDMDDKPHLGAMAQDYQKAFGDKVSDGKTVDIISAIGLNLAATKALSDKVDQIVKGKLPVKKPIKNVRKSDNDGDFDNSNKNESTEIEDDDPKKMIGLSMLNTSDKKSIDKREGK
jgi:hypothetical protein